MSFLRLRHSNSEGSSVGIGAAVVESEGEAGWEKEVGGEGRVEGSVFVGALDSDCRLRWCGLRGTRVLVLEVGHLGMVQGCYGREWPLVCSRRALLLE